jgi:Fur family transcriptional regulator, zinc uptake regulator
MPAIRMPAKPPPPNAHAHAHPHPHAPADASSACARAERYSQAAGVSFTPMRRRVLDALLEAGVPVTAYDLAERLSGPRRVAPVQIYRALDFLIEAGVVHRLATRSAFMACDHEHARGETTVFLVCGDCGSVAEVASAAVGRGLKGAAADNDFEPVHPVIEVSGRCAACRAQA